MDEDKKRFFISFTGCLLGASTAEMLGHAFGALGGLICVGIGTICIIAGYFL